MRPQLKGRGRGGDDVGGLLQGLTGLLLTLGSDHLEEPVPVPVPVPVPNPVPFSAFLLLFLLLLLPYLGPGLPGSLGLRRHGSLQGLGQPHVLHLQGSGWHLGEAGGGGGGGVGGREE